MAEADKTAGVGKAALATLVTVFLHSWVPVGLGVFLAYGAPRFESHFADAGVALPVLTDHVIEFSQRFRADWLKFTIIACLLLALDGVLLFMLHRSLGSIAAAVLSALVIVTEIGAAAACILAVLIPFWGQPKEVALRTPLPVVAPMSLPALVERPDL